MACSYSVRTISYYVLFGTKTHGRKESLPAELSHVSLQHSVSPALCIYDYRGISVINVAVFCHREFLDGSSSEWL